LLTSVDGLAGSVADGGTTLASEAGAHDDATVDAATDGMADGGVETSTKYAFTDDFNRADTVSGLGNGWNEKHIAFRISDGAADRLNPGSTEYQDNIATRPSAEMVGDVEVSVELRFKTTSDAFAQVHARVQTAGLSSPGALTSYILFRNAGTPDSKTFTIARQVGSDIFTTLTDFQTATPINTTNRYRMRLAVIGTSPVALTAFVEQENGTSWDLLATTTASDTSPDRIATPGVVGISSSTEATGAYAYDNFSAKGL
jgi:hypothetical protein